MPIEYDHSLAQFLDAHSKSEALATTGPRPSADVSASEESQDTPGARRKMGDRQLMAAEYLKMLGRSEFEFRCFIDDKASNHQGRPASIIGNFEERGVALKRLNDQGYGVFVQVNAGDGKGNKNANIVQASCHFVDLDGAPLENVKRLAIEPTAIYETSPGKWHAYWRVSGIAIDEFKGVQQRLAALCESDKAVVDLARVMRLPGFFHMKDSAQPFLVRRVGGSGAVIEMSAFLAALAAAEQAHGLKAAKQTGKPAAKPRSEEGDADFRRAEAMLRFLIESGLLNIAEYSEWRDLGFALKASYGQAGWVLFHALSSEDASYDGEEACQKLWNSDGEPGEGKKITIATFFRRANDAGYEGSGGGGSKGGGGGATGKSRSDHAIDVLRQAQTEGDEYFLDQHNEPYVSFRRNSDGSGPRVNAPIASEIYAGLLRLRFLDEMETKTLPKEALNSAIDILKARAHQANKRMRIDFRTGACDGAIYVDLGRDDGMQIRVDADGYKLVEDSPVRFAVSGRAEMPMPEDGATLADVERHAPNLSRADAQRWLGFMINSFNPSGTYPLLSFSAGAGHGKTVLGDKTVALVDPVSERETARLSFPKKEDDAIVQGRSAHVLLYDNVSSFTADQADLLCKITGGAGLTKRALYTDGTAYSVSIRRPVVITSIGSPSDRGDLLDRTLSVSPNELTRSISEEEIWASFEADRPKLFGLILRGVSAALRNKSHVAAMETSGEIRLPRLSDFARFVEGAHEVIGLDPGAFSRMLREGQKTLKGEAAANDALGAAIIRTLSRNRSRTIEGSAAEILDALSSGPDEERRALPAPNKVRHQLLRIEAGLRDVGIEVSFTQPSGKANVYRMNISATDAFLPMDFSKAETI